MNTRLTEEEKGPAATFCLDFFLFFIQEIENLLHNGFSKLISRAFYANEC